MTRDQKTFRSMAIGMAIIISFSATMHVFLIRRKAIKAHRYEPTYGNQPTESADKTLLAGGGTVEGEVIAVSFDKFFLRVNGKVQPFMVQQRAMPEVGQRLSVSYAGGRPPQAVDFQELPAGH